MQIMPDQIIFLNPPLLSTHALLAFSEVTGLFILLGIGDFPMQVPVGVSYEWAVTYHTSRLT